MFADAHCPETLNPEELDAYLEKGWFRMGQTIFTTNFLTFKNQLFSAIWLRVGLTGFSADKTQQKLTKLNAAFRVEIQKASITPAKEALYANYKQGISFEASSSINHLLFGRATRTIYNTHEVNIYDADSLIATGFFDMGKTSAAGITCFYDPAYKKYSLGKYLIYLKMDYCKKLALHYFYPGYFVPGYPFFDYKLEIGKPTLQYLQLTSQQWLPILSFSPELCPLQIMFEKLFKLQILLEESKITRRVLKYEFFDANLIPILQGTELFDYPLFLSFSESEEDNTTQVIVYDVRDQHYHLINCMGVWKRNSTNNINEFYSSNVLKIEEVLFSTESPEELVTLILIEMKLQTFRTNTC